MYNLEVDLSMFYDIREDEEAIIISSSRLNAVVLQGNEKVDFIPCGGQWLVQPEEYRVPGGSGGTIEREDCRLWRTALTEFERGLTTGQRESRFSLHAVDKGQYCLQKTDEQFFRFGTNTSLSLLSRCFQKALNAEFLFKLTENKIGYVGVGRLTLGMAKGGLFGFSHYFFHSI
ncbi:hypothetical protein TNCV_1596641 [Trichonephila clavipes]|nr:hypothetical protein TNCV_1596641 [Trichonephila clavipes]